MKVFNYSELHFAEVTFYKIHTLGLELGILHIKPMNFNYLNFSFLMNLQAIYEEGMLR